ncbi:MAG: hypothetical protein OHK0013_06280 [Sandaracinaceae bacterium]
MPIQIVPHAHEWKDKVDAFNRRMQAAGSQWGFYVDPEPTWIPKRREGQPSWREYWLCVEDGETVRGGYALKPQKWLLRGREALVTDWQGPFTEGAIDKRYAALGMRLVRDMLKKYPLLFSWGHGADDAPILQMVKALGWLVLPTPVAIRVVNPYQFLRRNRILRDRPERRVALDALALSGLGTLGISGLHQAMRLGSGRLYRADVEEVEAFGPWADALWERARFAYQALAVRDADAMNTLLPPGQTQPEWSRPRRYHVRRAERTVGWVVTTCRKLVDDHRFGDLQVGCLVDYFAHPDDAPFVVAAGFRALRREGADVVFANQSDRRWHNAFRRNGFLLLEGKRLFAASPALKERLEPTEELQRGGLFLTNMDGHGPQGL